VETHIDLLNVDAFDVDISPREWSSRRSAPERSAPDRPDVRPRRALRGKRASRLCRGPERKASPMTANPLPADVSDESLLAGLRHGDVSAGEALVGRYYAPLMRYLQRMAGPRAAEDLHQQTWLSILSHLDRFVVSTKGGSFRGWLFRIATNKTKDHWRSLSREKSAKEGLKRTIDGETPWAGHAADGAEQQEKLRRALEQLPQTQREVLLLRYYSNMKFVDIAAILGCPVNTALTRAHKGLIKLRQSMGQESADVAR
jgi:RNA polymerase sigma-70 factor, ECF subfamily